MAVKAYFEYPKFQKKMMDGNRLTRAIGMMSHPFFYKYCNDGRWFHPKQWSAIMELDRFIRANRIVFIHPSAEENGSREKIFVAAQKISMSSNSTSVVERKKLLDGMFAIAGKHGLGTGFYLDAGIRKLEISESYRELAEALIGFSGAVSEDSLLVGSLGKGVLFVVETDKRGTVDAQGLELVRLCAEALGGRLVQMCGDSTDRFELALPAKMK